MARLTVNTTAEATIDGIRREFRASSIHEVAQIVDVEAKVDHSDEPATIFTITPGTKGGAAALENFQFLGIKNAGSTVLEIMIKLLQYRDNSTSDVYAATASPFHQQPYLSALIYPGQHATLPCPRLLIYNEDIGGTAPESAAAAKLVSGVNNVTKAVTSGTDRGPTDGTGYVTHSTHFTETDTNGVVPGSYVINFYAAGYQALSLTDTTNKRLPVTENDDTNVALNTAYAFNIALDGGSAVTISFTTDSSNEKLGDPTDSSDTGVLRKIQEALDNNNTARGTTVRIVDGDIRFTSRFRKSESAVALAAPSSGTTIWGVGIFPAIGDVGSAVAATLEGDTGVSAKRGSTQLLIEGNTDHLMLDNGDGTLSRVNGGSGYIDYDEGGDVSLYGCPPFAEFHIAYYYDAAHSGEVSSHATTGNIMYSVAARSVSPLKQGKIKLTAFG